MRRHHTYLFTLTQRTVVDGGAGGNASRLINHSCDPNCEAVIEDGRIWIDAVRTIVDAIRFIAYTHVNQFDTETPVAAGNSENCSFR